MSTIILFIIIILFASIMQTSTGFGFSIISTPFMLLIIEPREAVQISLILALVISFALISDVKKDVDTGILKRFTIGSIIGLPVGMTVFLILNMVWLKIGISVLILALTVLLILNVRLTQSNLKDLVIGGFSGAFTTSIGMSGPPILLYFSGTDTTKEKLRGTTVTYYLFICSISLIVQIIFAGTTKLVWTYSLMSLPFVLIGLILGRMMFNRINQKAFRILTYGLLIFTGLYLLIEQVG